MVGERPLLWEWRLCPPQFQGGQCQKSLAPIFGWCLGRMLVDPEPRRPGDWDLPILIYAMTTAVEVDRLLGERR